MILFGYGCIFAVVVLVAFRGTIPRLPPLIDTPLRGLSIIVAAGAALAATLAIATRHKSALGQVILLLLLTGSVTFLYGQLSDRWLGSGHVFRALGWMLSVAALIIPTTLTLLLPVASILVFSVHPRTPVENHKAARS
jgi:hypothetical protein